MLDLHIHEQFMTTVKVSLRQANAHGKLRPGRETSALLPLLQRSLATFMNHMVSLMGQSCHQRDERSYGERLEPAHDGIRILYEPKEYCCSRCYTKGKLARQRALAILYERDVSFLLERVDTKSAVS